MTQETFSVRSHHGSKSIVEKLQAIFPLVRGFPAVPTVIPLHYI